MRALYTREDMLFDLEAQGWKMCPNCGPKKFGCRCCPMCGAAENKKHLTWCDESGLNDFSWADE